MTLYSSKTPRDLNHDPKAWKCTSCGDRFVREQGVNAPTSHVTRRVPLRPEFDHVQHNEPNPILVSARGQIASDIPLDYLIHTVNFDHLMDLWRENYGATRAHIVHARRVLTRLAAFEGES